MKKKILVFHPVIAPYRVDLFNELATHYDATICLFWRNLKNQTFDYAKIEELFVFTPHYIVKEEVGIIRWIKTLWVQLSLSAPDIVLTNEYGVPTIVALIHRMIRRKRYKIVSMVDDSYNMVAKGNHFTWKHEKAISIIAPMLDGLICVEPKVCLWYQEKYTKAIYFPIIRDDELYRDKLRSSLNISEGYISRYHLLNKKVLLFVGRLVAIKNRDFIIRCFKKARIENLYLVIVGSGPEYNELVRIADNQENIIFTGRLEGERLYAWYNIANVFTLPSLQEAFGAVTNEALVAGCKVLISQDAGSNCLVTEGVNGFVIDPVDEELYIKRLRLITNNTEKIQFPLRLRESLMQENFKECLRQLVDSLDRMIL